MKSFIANTMILVRERFWLILINTVGLIGSVLTFMYAPSIIFAAPVVFGIWSIVHLCVWSATKYSRDRYFGNVSNQHAGIGLYCFFFGILALANVEAYMILNFSFTALMYGLLGYYALLRISPYGTLEITEAIIDWLSETLAPTFRLIGKAWSGMWGWAEKNRT